MMNTNDEKLRETLKKQIEVEKETIEMVKKAEERVSETAVKLAFLEIRLDSYKHQKFLEGFLEMLDVTPCDEWSAKAQRYVDRVKLERTVNSIKEKEIEMLSLAKKSLENVSDPIAEFMLNHLIGDEKHHRDTLMKLIRIIQKSPLQSVKAEKGTDIVCDD
jgi:hypothetical protein